MSKENKPKKVRKPRNGGIGKFFLALAVSVIVFIALIVLQTGMLNKYEKKAVVVAKKEVGANTDITEGNIGEFFTTIDYDVTNLPANYVSKEDMDEKLINTLTLTTIPKGQVVTDSAYISRKSVTGEIANLSGSELVEASFASDAISDAVAGTIRRGDIVDVIIYYSEETEGSQLISSDVEKIELNGIHVKQAYDGSGIAITEDSKDVAATMFDIVASKEDVDTLNEMLLYKMRGGYMRMAIVKTNDVAF